MPGYGEAMEEALASATSWDAETNAERAVDAAIPIIVEALAKAAEAEMLGSQVVGWLRGHLRTREQIVKGTWYENQS